VFAPALIGSVIEILQTIDRHNQEIEDGAIESQMLGDDDIDEQNVGSVILPDAKEFTDIVRQAVMESRLFEPFILLERRVITTISYEKVKNPQLQDTIMHT
jgi:hypothetical protein